MMESTRYRIVVNLSHFYRDYRSLAYILISAKLKTISDLQEKIADHFKVSKFYLTCQQKYLAPSEDVAVLQKEDHVCVIPEDILNHGMKDQSSELNSVEDAVTCHQKGNKSNEENGHIENSNSKEVPNDYCFELNISHCESKSTNDFNDKTSIMSLKNDEEQENENQQKLMNTVDQHPQIEITRHQCVSLNNLKTTKNILGNDETTKSKNSTYLPGNISLYADKNLEHFSDENGMNKQDSLCLVDNKSGDENEFISKQMVTNKNHSHFADYNKHKEITFSKNSSLPNLHSNHEETESEFSSMDEGNISEKNTQAIIKSHIIMRDGKIIQQKSSSMKNSSSESKNINISNAVSQHSSKFSLGKLLDQLRKDDVTPKRRRVRKRKRKHNINTSFNMHSQTDLKLDKSIGVFAQPSVHIRFDECVEDRTCDSVNMSQSSKVAKSSGYNSKTDDQLDHYCTDTIKVCKEKNSMLPNLKMQYSKEEDKNSEIPLEKANSTTPNECIILKCPPNIGDTVCFKILKMNKYYSPEISSGVLGKVTTYDIPSDKVTFKIIQGLEQCVIPKGKFLLELKEGNSTDDSDTKEFYWSQLIEPKLHYKKHKSE